MALSGMHSSLHFKKSVRSLRVGDPLVLKSRSGVKNAETAVELELLQEGLACKSVRGDKKRTRFL